MRVDFYYMLFLSVFLNFGVNFINASRYSGLELVRWRERKPTSDKKKIVSLNDETKIIANDLGGGYAGYNGSLVNRRIDQSTGSLKLPDNDLTYYYGYRYFYKSYLYDSSKKTCVYDIDEDDPYFDLTFDEDGRPVTEIAYQCKTSQNCCNGLDCCAKPLPWWAILLIVLAIIGLLICCLLCICQVFAQRNRGRALTKDRNYDMHEVKGQYVQGHGYTPMIYVTSEDTSPPKSPPTGGLYMHRLIHDDYLPKNDNGDRRRYFATT